MRWKVCLDGEATHATKHTSSNTSCSIDTLFASTVRSVDRSRNDARCFLYAVWHESEAWAGRSVRPWKEPWRDTNTVSRPGCGAASSCVLVILRASTSMMRMARLTHSDPLFKQTKPSYLQDNATCVNSIPPLAPHVEHHTILSRHVRAVVIKLGSRLSTRVGGASGVPNL